MEPLALSLDRIVRDAPGWYQGDFHCHTHHSDGALSPAELMAVARQEGMDFFAITDHNTLDAYPHFGEPEGLCVIPGLEVTFDQGHYNVFGVTQLWPWLEPVRGGPTQLNHARSGVDVNALMAAAQENGLLNSINHPILPPWAWLLGETDLRRVDCLEIWNDPSWPTNRQGNPDALEMWTRWLNAGHRITAVGGSDYHRPVNKPGVGKPPDRLGLPRTFVHATQLSGRAILAGLRSRQVYVSMGAQVTFAAVTAADRYPIGADLGRQGGPVDLVGRVTRGGGGGVARILHNGAIVAEVLVPWEAGAPFEIRHSVTLDPQRSDWFRLEVLDGNGMILAVTNPIYAGPVPTPTRNRYADFVDVAIPALHPAG
jgi:hypothetical protein